MKHKADCESLEEVRQAIDALDREVIYSLGRRARYVEVAAHFKTGEEGVRDPERQRTMLETRRRWAEENGLDPDLVEGLYRTLLSYFIDREMQEWRET